MIAFPQTDIKVINLVERARRSLTGTDELQTEVIHKQTIRLHPFRSAK